MIRPLYFSLGSLAMLALSASPSLAQDNQLPVSRTTGVLTIALPKAKATLMALPMVDIMAAGTIDSVNGSVYEVISSPPAMPNVIATPHALKITSRVDQRGAGVNAPGGSSRNSYGISARITAQTGQELTAALAVAPNEEDKFVVYALRTIGSVFGSANSAGLNGAATAEAADILYLSSGAGFEGYFYNTAASAWRLVSSPDGADQTGKVIDPSEAILVVRQDAGSDVSLRVSGNTMPGRETLVVAAGFKLVNNPFTIATTLEASGLRSHVTGGTSAGSADLLYLEEEGVLTAYFYKTGGLGGSGWRALGDNATNHGGTLVNPGKAILFKEQAGTAGFALPEPFAE